MNARKTLAVLAACTVLAACGGGGGGGGGDTAASGSGGAGLAEAQSSVQGLIAYMQRLIASTNETDEPLSLGDITLPVDDAAEPASI